MIEGLCKSDRGVAALSFQEKGKQKLLRKEIKDLRKDFHTLSAPGRGGSVAGRWWG